MDNFFGDSRVCGLCGWLWLIHRLVDEVGKGKEGFESWVLFTFGLFHCLGYKEIFIFVMNCTQLGCLLRINSKILFSVLFLSGLSNQKEGFRIFQDLVYLCLCVVQFD